ncbi:MAG: outer membrane protein assembly factor BamA [Spirochaetaceae bacterium]|nr:outer membrane protein assembly factor BamA [Spirochaetaceae bacterium]
MMNCRNLFRRVLMLFLVLLFTITAFAQTSDTWYYGKKIRNIDFKGLENVNSMELSGITSPFIGQEFTDELYLDLLNRVYALDLFEDVSPIALPGDAKGDSVVIEFTVVEKPFVSQLKFTGNRHIRASELKAAISTKAKDIYNSSKILLDERAIRDLYLKKGYTNVRVSSTTVEKDNEIEVTFEISEGRSTVVREISFMGNTVVSSKTLKGLLSMKTVGIFNKGAFQESQLEIDKQSIIAYYQNRGYVDVAILDVVRTVTYNEKDDCDELNIQYVIQEGAQYIFSGITFTGNTIFSTEQLRDLIKLQDGDVFNLGRFQEGLVAVTDLYFENGYTSNYFNPVESKNAETRQIAVNFMIMENPRSHIENIFIKGNEKTKDYVILRELPIESGDIFSKTKITTGLRNLFNLQYFSAIVPEIVAGSEENLVDVVLNLEEQSTTSIEFGVTFSGIADPDAFPVSLFFKWQDANVMGTGKLVSANTTLSTDSQSLALSYGDSWLFGMPISFSASAGISHTISNTLRSVVLPDGSINNKSYYMNYNQLSFDFGASLGRRWIPDYAILSVSGGISSSILRNFYDDTIYTPADKTIADNQKRWGMKNSIWVAGSIDARDLNYDPSRGWFAKQQFSWTGLVPMAEKQFFMSSDTKAEIYFTLLDLPITDVWNLKFVLAGLTSLSFVEPTPNTELSSSNMLYIDGMFTGRGWSSLYSTHRGQALWNNTVEWRMPVAPGIFALDFFFDAAVIKDTARTFFTDLNINDVFFSFGPGFRFSLPQFPLRMMLANTFQVKDGSVKWRNGEGPEWDFVLSFNITNR